jgi:Flp pilus assembly protein TadG
VSAVELAITLPIMMIFLLGMIDAGQSVNVWNKVDNASREGARIAVRETTASSDDVTATVARYIDGAFPGVSDEKLASGLSTTVRNANGDVITDLTKVATGAPMTVEVRLNYDTVRWLKNVGIFSNRQISTITQMRRE